MIAVEERAKSAAKKANAESKRKLRNILNANLTFINEQVPNAALAAVFQRTVEYLAAKPYRQKSLFRSSEVDQINLEDIVSRVKDRVNAVPTGSERYIACRGIIQDAIRELKKPLNQEKREILEQEEMKAVGIDQQRYDSVQQSPPIQPDPDIELKITLMGSPGDPKQEYPLRQDRFMKTYRDIVFALCSKLEKPPWRLHLWARRVDPSIRTDALCPGLHWVHVVGQFPIEGTEFGIVDLDKVSHYYIVALVNRNEIEEIPCPIDIPLPNEDSCCVPACESLTTHIQSIWRNSRVKNALMLPDDRCVRQMRLNSYDFPPYRNDLYLRVSERDEEIHNVTVIGTPV
ncbi:hypothetical protein FRC18_009509 [Serendipita sp. 400]|nr:hypothetical protein FRC18_009509 [Serendipita sp. 400]